VVRGSAEFAALWLHRVTAIAWIGSPFHFIALGPRPSADRRESVSGEAWRVHGDGFYHIQKYMISPSRMPVALTWFKSESYATWLTGAAMLIQVYWLGAELHLIDPAQAALSSWVAVAISGLALTIGWLVNDRLRKSGIAARSILFRALLFVLLLVMGWGHNQVFPLAVLLRLGAFTATIMTAVSRSTLGQDTSAGSRATRALAPGEVRFAEAAGVGDVAGLVMGNCAMCHVRETARGGIGAAPKGVLLGTEADAAAHAHRIFRQSSLTDAMPPVAARCREPEDCAAIVVWYLAAAG